MASDGSEAMTDKDEQPQRADRDQDQTVADSFPASDPPAHTGITGPVGKGVRSDEQRPPRRRNDDERPTGTPTSGRHATETAHVRLHEAHPPVRR
jgi:hypothetical protein